MNHLSKDYTELLNKDISFFEGVKTKELLDGYRKLSIWRSRMWYDVDYGYGNEEDLKILDTLCENIKAVLNTREHIPNKKERKALRQLAAKRRV